MAYLQLKRGPSGTHEVHNASGKIAEMMDGHLREYAQAELGMEYHPKAQTAAEKFNRLVRATAKEQRLNEGDAVHVVLMSDPGKALFAVRREDLLDESRAGQQGKLVRRP